MAPAVIELLDRAEGRALLGNEDVRIRNVAHRVEPQQRAREVSGHRCENALARFLLIKKECPIFKVHTVPREEPRIVATKSGIRERDDEWLQRLEGSERAAGGLGISSTTTAEATSTIAPLTELARFLLGVDDRAEALFVVESIEELPPLEGREVAHHGLRIRKIGEDYLRVEGQLHNEAPLRFRNRPGPQTAADHRGGESAESLGRNHAERSQSRASWEAESVSGSRLVGNNLPIVGI